MKIRTRNKEITRLLFPSEVVATFAKCSIEISPYNYPDRLLQVLDLLDSYITPDNADTLAGNYFIKLNEKEFYSLLKTFIYANCRDWNTPRRYRETPELAPQIACTSRYSVKLDPGDDFIDLDALCQNVTNDIFDRHCRLELSDREFDRAWKREWPIRVWQEIIHRLRLKLWRGSVRSGGADC